MLIILALCLLVLPKVFSQGLIKSSDSTKIIVFPKKNYFLGDIRWGAFYGLVVGINYNRIIYSKPNIKADFKVGFGISGPSAQFLPINTSIYFGAKNHFLEIGYIILPSCIRYGSAVYSGLGSTNSTNTLPMIVSRFSIQHQPIIGYRYFANKKFTLRAYYGPIFEPYFGTISHSVSFSMGFGF